MIVFILEMEIIADRKDVRIAGATYYRLDFGEENGGKQLVFKFTAVMDNGRKCDRRDFRADIRKNSLHELYCIAKFLELSEAKTEEEQEEELAAFDLHSKDGMTDPETRSFIRIRRMELTNAILQSCGCDDLVDIDDIDENDAGNLDEYDDEADEDDDDDANE